MAKNLSLQGRDMNERMKECHREVKIPTYIYHELGLWCDRRRELFFRKEIVRHP